MIPRGFDKSLYVLPFDHRASFEKGLFGFSPPLTTEQNRYRSSKGTVMLLTTVWAPFNTVWR